jgi:hypothetical protein
MKMNLWFLLLISLFLGFVCVGTAIGTIIPSINRISAPLVCNGQMLVEVRHYSVRPGEQSTQNNIYCVDETTGEKRDISILAIVVSCLIYSAIIFLLFITNMLWKRLRGNPVQEPPIGLAPPVSPQNLAQPANIRYSGEDPAISLNKLKELREANLITEQEYETKKAEILSRM